MKNERAVARFRDSLRVQGDGDRAVQMAAYMKTDMPFFGVPAPERRRLEGMLRKQVAVDSRDDYVELVLGLWGHNEREMKYAAIGMARAFKKWIGVDCLALYRQMIEEGGWWDFVDEIAQHLVGACYAKQSAEVGEAMDEWISDPNMWVRRAAIISQNRRKDETDAVRLFKYCDLASAEKHFFIRKAIGWALRDYSYVAPQAVFDYLESRRDRLSGLSFREGARVLKKKGWTFSEPV